MDLSKRCIQKNKTIKYVSFHYLVQITGLHFANELANFSKVMIQIVRKYYVPHTNI